MVFKTRARVSEVTGKRRRLSLAMIRKLHETLSIPVESLVAEYPLRRKRGPRSAAIRLSSVEVRQDSYIGFEPAARAVAPRMLLGVYADFPNHLDGGVNTSIGRNSAIGSGSSNVKPLTLSRSIADISSRVAAWESRSNRWFSNDANSPSSGNLG